MPSSDDATPVSTEARPAPARRRVGGRLRWLLAGVVLTLLVFEVLFRIVGFGYRLVRAGAPGGPAKYTIVCEGDSFTFGIGGEDFPRQLEAVLNARAGQRLFRVINLGVPGQNSALIADNFEAHLLSHQPDLTIVTTGENNAWNSIRLRSPRGAPSWRAAVDGALLHLRVYKAAKIMWLGLRHGTFHAAAGERQPTTPEELERYANHLADLNEQDQAPQRTRAEVDALRTDPAMALSREGDYEGSLRLMRARVAAGQARLETYTFIAGSCLRLNLVDEAIAALEQGLARFPAGSEEAFSELGWAHERKGDAPAAYRAWKRGLLLFPASGGLYQALVRTYHARSGVWRPAEYERENPRIVENRLHRFLALVAQRYGAVNLYGPIRESFRADLRAMSDLARRHRVGVIFTSYPEAQYDVVAEVARERGHRYIDFRPAFRSRFSDRSQYISPDLCHCNGAGYRFMAEVLADSVAEMMAQRGAPLPARAR
jgi:lysophospholipase L1-like esterase